MADEFADVGHLPKTVSKQAKGMPLWIASCGVSDENRGIN